MTYCRETRDKKNAVRERVKSALNWNSNYLDYFWPDTVSDCAGLGVPDWITEK
jgi:hypothetical protein